MVGPGSHYCSEAEPDPKHLALSPNGLLYPYRTGQAHECPCGQRKAGCLGLRPGAPHSGMGRRR